MSYAECVKMYPWIGSKYRSMEPKVLIVGESLYGGYATRNRIKKDIEGIANGNWTHAFFTKLLKAFHLEGRTNNYNETCFPSKSDFWNTVSYYEYIQHAMHEPRETVRPQYWEEAKEAFISVCKNLKPDIVLCIGKETFSHLPESFKEWSIGEMNIKDYTFSEKVMHVCSIHHPSAPGFSIEKWFNLFTQILDSF